jgi:hypothetical protein
VSKLFFGAAPAAAAAQGNSQRHRKRIRLGLSSHPLLDLMHGSDSKSDHFGGPDDSDPLIEQRLGLGPLCLEALFNGAFRSVLPAFRARASPA